MEEQLSRPASRSSTFASLVVQELRAAGRRPQFLALAALVVLVAPVSGMLSLGGAAYDHWVSYFTTMFDWVGLAYPLVVALLTQPRLLDEWANSYASYTRTRLRPARYFWMKALTSAVIAAVVFLAMTLTCFAVARATYTDHGYGVPLAGAIESRYPLSQLWAVSPALYVIGFSAWVALVTAAVAIWCTLLTAVIANRFVALAAPPVLWFLANFGMAVLGLEELSLPPFRFQITQQPIWTEFAGLGAIVLFSTALGVVIRRRDYLTPGIVRE